MKSHYVKPAPNMVIAQKWEKISWTSRSSLKTGKMSLNQALQCGFRAGDSYLPPVLFKSSRYWFETISPTNTAYLPRVASKYKHQDRETFNNYGN